MPEHVARRFHAVRKGVDVRLLLAATGSHVREANQELRPCPNSHDSPAASTDDPSSPTLEQLAYVNLYLHCEVEYGNLGTCEARSATQGCCTSKWNPHYWIHEQEQEDQCTLES